MISITSVKFSTDLLEILWLYWEMNRFFAEKNLHSLTTCTEIPALCSSSWLLLEVFYSVQHDGHSNIFNLPCRPKSNGITGDVSIATLAAAIKSSIVYLLLKHTIIGLIWTGVTGLHSVCTVELGLRYWVLIIFTV